MNSRRPKRDLGWIPTIFGVFMSVGLGLVFYFSTDLKTAIATLAGLIGTTIALQVELIIRERRTVDSATRQQRINSVIEGVPWLPAILEEILMATIAVDQHYSKTMAVKLARKSFETCLGELRGLQRGFFETPYDDTILLYELLRQSRETVFATSVSPDDLSWWNSPHGQTYLHLHQEAIDRGVAIRRIFIYDDWKDAHEQVAAAQHAIGVETLWVQRNLLPADIQLDMIIWDSLCGYRSRLNSAGEAIANHYTFSSLDIRKLEDQFAMIESCAERWAPTQRNSQDAR